MKKRRFAFLLIFIAASCSGSFIKKISSKVNELVDYTVDEIKRFEVFKNVFNKSYPTKRKEKHALLNFLFNQRDIKQHNLRFKEGLTTFTRSIFSFSDMSTEEFNELVNRFMRPVETKALRDEVNVENIPRSLNWTAEGIVSSVQNQGLCGCCWSFSAIGAIEAQLFIKTGNLTKLSEQNLIDCNRDDDIGNFGCKGGDMLSAFNHVSAQKGISLASKYPYKENDTFKCKFNYFKSIPIDIKSHKIIEGGDEKQLQLMVTKYGPVSIAVDASLASFHSYKSGIYNDSNCTRNINHAMLLVGYGRDKATKRDFWLLKNSYGEKWGENGYMRLARNAGNHCGIAEFAVVPILR